ncbi:glycosyltransferase family 2 protein [Roseomonas sp. ACRSG]|nr:glycosyltransferase family 2 protein [Roseomonas sp. ACRSG]
MSDDAVFSTLFPQGAALDDAKAYAAWIGEFATLTEQDGTAIRRHLPGLRVRPHFAVSLPVGHADPYLVVATLASLEAQLYPYWNACVAVAPGQEEVVRKALARRQLSTTRITFLHGAAPESAAAQGDFVAALDPGDLLAPEAFYEMAVAIADHPEALLLYSDEDAVGLGGSRSAPRFKPAFSPDPLRLGDSIGQLALFARSVVGTGKDRLTWARHAVAEAGAAFPERIIHVPALLCQRRNPPAPPAPMAGSTPQPTSAALHDGPLPLVSVLIPTRDRADLLERCVEGLLHRTDYPALEILVVDNDSQEAATLGLFERWHAEPQIRVLPFPGAFNWAAVNNLAAAEARGEVLLLLNNDIEVMSPGWLREMVRLARQPDIGLVGARLLYPDGLLQHGGILLGPAGSAQHVQRFARPDEPGYLGRFLSPHDLSAVTGACMAIRRTVFQELGGLEQQELQVEWSDIEICLRLRDRGYRVVWTPYATLRHWESASLGSSATPERRARFLAEQAAVLRIWPGPMEHDPFLNPNLLASETDLLLSVPRRRRPWEL